MNRSSFFAGIVATLFGLVFVVLAAERNIAVSRTSEALEVVQQGLDWDKTTSISVSQRQERLNANLDVIRTQRSQRNRWTTLSVLMITLAGACGLFSRRKSATKSAE